MKRTKKHWHAVPAFVCICAVMLFASCKRGDRGLLETMFTIEGRTARSMPPSSVEELQSAIEQYGGEVKKTADLMANVGTYWRLLAGKYMEKGMYGDAYEAAKNALEHYPNSSGLYYTVGLSAAWLSKTAAIEQSGAAQKRASWLGISEAAYKQAAEIDPNNISALYGLAVLYSFEIEDHEAALETLTRLFVIDKSNIDAMFVYARSLYGSGRLQEAADAYDAIIQSAKLESKRQEAVNNKKAVLDALYGK